MHVLVLANLQKQIEFFGEERIVVLQSKAEERKRFDGRPPAYDHLRASLRQQIERGEALKYPHRIGSAQNRDSAGETDAMCSRRRCAENDGRRGIEELTTMVFTDAKDIQAHLIGVFDLLDQVSQTVLRAHGKTAVVESGGEAVNSDLHQGARSTANARV